MQWFQQISILYKSKKVFLIQNSKQVVFVQSTYTVLYDKKKANNTAHIVLNL